MIGFWFKNARPISLPQSLMPAFVACFMAAAYTDFKWHLALCGLIGIGFAHLSLNLFDDLFDYLNADQGERNALERQGMRAMTAKCPALQDGTANPWQWAFAACIFGAIACVFGLPLFIVRGWAIVLVVLAVAVLGIFYSAKPFKLSYNGFGEIIIGTIFGPLIMIGICLGASGEFHARDILVSVCLGLLVVNILYVHSIMDFAADMRCGKRTLAWLAHGESRQYIVLVIINFLPYAILAAGIAGGLLSPLFFIAYLALPLSVALVSSMFKFKKDPFGKVEKKAWYGRFSNWKEICAAGIDWFMLRWLLAQKIDTVFALLCIIAVIIGFLI